MSAFNRRGGKMPEIPASLHLPPVLYKMFGPKRDIPFVKKEYPSNYRREVSGVASFLKEFEAETPRKIPRIVKRENVLDIKEKRKARKAAELKEKLEKDRKGFSPKKRFKENPAAYTEDALNTLFVGRLSFVTTEQTLQEVFSQFGEIKAIKLIRRNEKDTKAPGKSRGYAFIEFANGRDMKEAYRKANKLEIDGRSILTDVERGRTVKEWLPRRLGGGLGGASRRETRTRRNPVNRERKRRV